MPGVRGRRGTQPEIAQEDKRRRWECLQQPSLLGGVLGEILGCL